MNRSSQAYEAVYLPVFQDQLQELKQKDRVRAKRIQNAVEEILGHPYQNMDFGKGRWRGKRKYYVGNDRIMFVVCGQCRKLGHKRFNQCSDCASTKDETVLFVSIIQGHEY